jgi:heat shock protein HslJ
MNAVMPIAGKQINASNADDLSAVQAQRFSRIIGELSSMAGAGDAGTDVTYTEVNGTGCPDAIQREESREAGRAGPVSGETGCNGRITGKGGDR